MSHETIAPHGLVVERGAIGEIGTMLQAMSVDRVLVIGGKRALESASVGIERSVKSSIPQAHIRTEIFEGQCSERNVRKFEAIAREESADGIVAVGGGKAIDAVKLVAQNCGVPVVTVPTSAATCAAWTALTVVYTDDGSYDSYEKLHLCPSRIIMDLEVLLESPVRLLASGIGDAIVKWYELQVAVSAGVPLNAMTRTALSIAATCREILLEESAEAFTQAKERRFGDEFANVVETCIKLPGLVSGVTTGSHLSVAHAFYNALTFHRTCRASLHGEIVFFGLLVQCLLFDVGDDEFERLVHLGRTLGLPLSLSSLGLDESSSSALSDIAAYILSIVRFEKVRDSIGEVTTDRIIEVIRRTNSLCQSGD